MSKRLTLSMGLLALAASPVVAHASHSAGNGPEDVLVSGTAIRTAVLASGSKTRVMMGISARGGAAGENARGRFFVKRTTEPPVPGRPDLDYVGEVTCLRVVGNRAIVGGVITDDRVDLASNPIEDTGFVGAYVDNDQTDTDAPDESNSSPGIAAPGDTCPMNVAFPTAPFQQGNYVVHDDTP